MDRLELEFLTHRRPAGWPSWLLLCLALAFLLDLGRSWALLRTQVAQQESRISTRRVEEPARAPGMMRVASTTAAAGEVAAARDTIERLSIPWERLFAALEAAQTENTALLSIEPDPEKGGVTLTAEAKDYLAALSYVANLENQKALTKVAMTRHELKPGVPLRPVLIVVSASWNRRP